MAIDFPSSPTNDQIFSSNGRTWIFSTSANVWLNGDNTAIGVGANTVGSAAFAKANAALANVTGTFAGNLTVSGNLITTENAGIGTSNPTARLNIVDSTSQDAVRITQTGTGNALVIEGDANPDGSTLVVTANGALISGSNVAYSADTIVPRIQVSSNTFEDGIVGGFGWSWPPQIVMARGSSTSTTIGVQEQLFNGDGLGEIRFFGSDGVDFLRGAGIAASVDGTPGTGDMPTRLLFYTRAAAAGSWTVRMAISASGNVGIGRTNPGHRLDVVGTINASNIMINGGPLSVINANLDSVNTTRYLVFDDAVTGVFNRANVSHGITYNPSSNTLNTGNLVVTGNVGLGRANPGFRLDVVGTINASNVLVNGAPLTASGGGATILTDTVSATRYVTFANNTTGTFSQANVATSLTFNPSTGTLSATIFNATSDINSKQNIKTIENGLDIINSLRGVSFDWKDTGKPSYGLIAQEVEQHLPALVYTDENGKKSLNYDAIIGFLVEAIKELKKNG